MNRFRSKKLPGDDGRAKPGTAGPGDWTGVYFDTLDPKTGKPGEALLTAFGGSDGGATEAIRLRDLLNKAMDEFYKT